MSVAHLLQFAALAAVLIVIPGPSVLFAVSLMLIGLGVSIAATGRKG
ncbi:MAG: hypothetical protein ABSB59_33455 [Streptosporangiaceae bacterium]|jgi:threonine/homoserine/homoserine lactone efflux protein